MANNKINLNALEVGKTYTLYVHNVRKGNKQQRASIDVKTSKNDKRSLTVPVDDKRLLSSLGTLLRQLVDFICREDNGKPRLFLADKYYDKPEMAQTEVVEQTETVQTEVVEQTETVQTEVVEQTEMVQTEMEQTEEKIEQVMNLPSPTQCIYEPGQEYKYPVFYHRTGTEKFSVQIPEGQVIEIPIIGELRKPLQTGSFVTLKCSGVKDGVPTFELPSSYYPLVIKEKEGLKVEFKSSIIFSPDNKSQPLQIAREIAAFANSDGGTLYLGVADSGVVTGIENDLPHLEEAEAKNGNYTDKNYTYHKNHDGFGLKLHFIIRCYLGELADSLVEGPKFINDEDSDGECTYAFVTVHPSKSIIYCGEKEEVLYRSDSSSVILNGRGRDEYIRKRFYDPVMQDYSQLMKQFKESQEAEQKETNAKLQELVDALKNGKLAPSTQVAGTRVTVLPETALLLSDPNFLTFEGKIKRAIYRMNTPEQLAEPATSWKEFYEAVLKILAKLDPEKFKTLPDNEDFQPTRKTTAPYFARKGDGRRLPVSSDYLGHDKDVRANLNAGGSRKSFLEDNCIPARVLAFFGVKPEDLAVEIEKGD